MTALSESEITRLRSETPGCAAVIHFNHAGSSLMSREVLRTTIEHLEREAEIGGYEAADEAASRLEAVYASAARLIGGAPDEIAIIENATRAWDMAFYGIAFREGDRILTSASEYASNVIAFLQVSRHGVSVEVVPSDEHGQLDVDALEAMLDDRVKVVAVTHMPTNGGLTQPAVEIGRIVAASDGNPLYILDACQTVGQMPLDVRAIGCHVLSATSRKYLRGPRGMGFLWVDRDRLPEIDPPLLDLHAARWVATDRYEIRLDARKFENWECDVAAKLGMGAAIDHALNIGPERIWPTIQKQARHLRERIGEVPGATVRDLGQVKGGIVTFTLAGVEADDIVAALKANRINSVSSSVSSTRFDMEFRGLDKIVRTSVHYLTTDAEIDALIETLRHITAP